MSDLASILPLQSQSDDVALIEIRVTTGCRDVLAHQGLLNRLPRFVRNVRGAYSIYRLTLAEAEALDDDAKSAHERVSGPEKKILTALAQQLRKSIFAKRTRGCVPDPGMNDFALMSLGVGVSRSPALFKVGDLALSIYGDDVRIVDELAFYKVATERGPYFDNDRIFDYLWGYRVTRVSDGERFFSPVDMLLEPSGELKYLKLITVDGKLVEVPSSLDMEAKG